VVIRPRSIPKLSKITLAGRARPFVVQLALLTMWCCSLSYARSFTPRTSVMSSPLAGAEMITFRAPAVRCAAAFSASVKIPVDSITMSTPRSPHGRAAGSFSLKALISWPSTVIVPSPDVTSPS
jgi:hypothetical protein